MRIILLILTTFITIASTSQNVVKVSPGTLVNATGNVLVTLNNLNLKNDGTINQAAGGGTFLFSGTRSDTISGSGLTTFDHVELARTGGSNLLLSQNINVASGIHFTSGLLDIRAQTIFLKSAALLYNESEISRIIGTSGHIEITKKLNAPSSENPGNLGAIITSSQDLRSTTVSRGHAPQSGTGMPGSILRYFDIIPGNNTSLNATLRFHYFDAELNGHSESSLSLWKGSHNVWNIEYFTSRNSFSNYVEKEGIYSFSRQTLSSYWVPPVRVSSLPGKNKIELKDEMTGAWPNPVKETTSIKISATAESIASIKVTDAKGALLRLQQHPLQQGNNIVTIDMKDLPAGVYHILTEWNKGESKKAIRVIKL